MLVIFARSIMNATLREPHNSVPRNEWNPPSHWLDHAGERRDHLTNRRSRND